MTRTLALTAASVLSLFILGAPAAGQAPSVLSDDGIIHELQAGPYRDFFPDDDLPAGTRVLVLTTTVEGVVTHQLVPSTETPSLDHRPMMLYDRAHDVVNVIWERREVGETQVELARFDGAAWSDVTTLFTRPNGYVTGASRALTREAHNWTAAGVPSTLNDRSIIHLAWKDADQATHYAPLIFIDGVFAGLGESFALASLIEVDSDVPAGSATDALLGSLSLDLGADGHHVQIAFADPRSDHVVVLRVRVQPLDLGFFAAEIRLGVEALTGLYQAGSASSIAGPLRAEIINSGSILGIEESVVSFVANTVEAWAHDWTALNPTANFTAFSAALVDLVNDLTLALFAGTDGDQVIELDLDSGNPLPPQRFQVSVASTRPAPATGDGLHRIFASTDGSRVLIAWYEATTGLVRYVESTDEPATPWSQPATIRLTETTTPERVEQLLRQRIR